MADSVSAERKTCLLPERAKLHLAMLALQFGYAGFHVVSRAALNMGISKVVFPVYRNIIALILLVPFAYFLEKKERPRINLSFLVQFFLLALCGITANQGFYLLGLEHTSPTFASAIQNSVPAITFLMAAALRLEQVHLNRKDGISKVAGTLLCVGGATVITLYKGPAIIKPYLNLADTSNETLLLLGSTKGKNWTLGCIFLIGHCLSWSGWLVLQAPVLKKYPARLSVTSYTCFFGVIQFLIIAAFIERDSQAWIVRSGGELFTIIYAGLVASGIAFAVQIWCIDRGGPVFVAVYQPVQTLVVAIMASVALGEQFYLGGLEQVHLNRKDGISKVAGTLLCVGGATVITLYKGPAIIKPYLNLADTSNETLLLLGSTKGKNWTLGCIFLIGHCLSWSGWLVLQAPVLKKYPARLSVTSYTCFFGVIQFLIIAAFIERDSQAWIVRSGGELFTIIYAGLVASGIAFAVQIWCIDRGGPVFVAVYQPVQTLVVAIMASVALGEQFYLGGLEQVHLNRKDGISKVAGTLLCVGGATVITLYKGPAIIKPYLNLADTSNETLLLLGSTKGKNWTLGCIFLIGHCLSWSGWLVLQAPVLKKYPARLSVTSYTCFFGVIQFLIIAAFIERDSQAWIVRSGGELFTIIYAGLVASGIAFAVQIWCIDRGGPVFVAVYQPVQTLVVAIMASVALGEQFYLGGLEQVHLNRKDGISKVAGTLLCVGGATVITLYKGPAIIKPYLNLADTSNETLLLLGSTKGKNWTLGCIFLIGHCLSWSGWLVLQAPVLKKYPARLSVTSYTCFFGVIQFLIIAAFIERDSQAWIVRSGGELFTIIYAGLVASGIAFAVQIWCIDRGGPVFVAVYQPVQTLVVAIMASVALGEQFYLGGIIGAVLIIAGLYLVLWGKSEEKRRAKENLMIINSERYGAHGVIGNRGLDSGIEGSKQKVSLTQPLLPPSSSTENVYIIEEFCR